MYWIKGVELNDNDITEYDNGKWMNIELDD